MRRIPARGITLNLGESVQLDDEAAHYVRDVLRLSEGARVEVFGTDGSAFEATIESLTPLRVRLQAEVDGQAHESPCEITLYQAIPKKDRFEWVLEKATELGVHQIVPMMTSRSVVKVPTQKADAKTERWQKICDAAARQSGRAVSPTVLAPRSLADALKGPAHACEVVLDPTAEAALTQSGEVSAATDVGIWIGPEGGFSADELASLSARAAAYRLGPRVLRSETAGIVAVTVVQALTGGLE